METNSFVLLSKYFFCRHNLLTYVVFTEGKHSATFGVLGTNEIMQGQVIINPAVGYLLLYPFVLVTVGVGV